MSPYLQILRAIHKVPRRCQQQKTAGSGGGGASGGGGGHAPSRSSLVVNICLSPLLSFFVFQNTIPLAFFAFFEHYAIVSIGAAGFHVPRTCFAGTLKRRPAINDEQFALWNNGTAPPLADDTTVATSLSYARCLLQLRGIRGPRLSPTRYVPRLRNTLVTP